MNGRVIRDRSEAARARVLLDLTDSGRLGVVLGPLAAVIASVDVSGDMPCPRDPGRDLDLAPSFCRKPLILPPLLELDVAVAEGESKRSLPVDTLDESHPRAGVLAALKGWERVSIGTPVRGASPTLSKCR